MLRVCSGEVTARDVLAVDAGVSSLSHAINCSSSSPRDKGVFGVNDKDGGTGSGFIERAGEFEKQELMSSSRSSSNDAVTGAGAGVDCTAGTCTFDSNVDGDSSRLEVPKITSAAGNKSGEGLSFADIS